MPRDWVVVGCGGHGREVADVIHQSGGQVVGFLDDDPGKTGSRVAGLPVLGTLAWLAQGRSPLAVAIGIGASVHRRDAALRLKSLGMDLEFPSIIHPSARIGSRAAIVEGTLIQAGCTLTCDIQVGNFVVLNVGAFLSHDALVGDYATLTPGARMAGATRCGELAEVGMGTLVIQQRSLGSACCTGAGSVVIRDIDPGTTVVGVPTRVVKHG